MFNDATFERRRRLIVESRPDDEMGMLDFSNPNNSGLLVLFFQRCKLGSQIICVDLFTCVTPGHIHFTFFKYR